MPESTTSAILQVLGATLIILVIVAVWRGIKCRYRYNRLELRYVSYEDANVLMSEDGSDWEIAREEDRNPVIGMVFLERRELVKVSFVRAVLGI